jgi:hypothetical protein
MNPRSLIPKGFQMQPVLEKKADGNVDQASRRPAEGQKNDQDAEINKDAAPDRRRQDVGSGGDGGGLSGGTVNRHQARTVLGIGDEAPYRPEA